MPRIVPIDRARKAATKRGQRFLGDEGETQAGHTPKAHLDRPMPFGKHKGTPVRDVPRGYLRWLHDNATLRGWLRTAVRELIDPDSKPQERPPEPARENDRLRTLLPPYADVHPVWPGTVIGGPGDEEPPFDADSNVLDSEFAAIVG